jgi:hypothetical protein
MLVDQDEQNSQDFCLAVNRRLKGYLVSPEIMSMLIFKRELCAKHAGDRRG